MDNSSFTTVVASGRTTLPSPSSLRISLPEPSVRTGVRGVVGMCTVMIVLISMFLLVG